ncbi:MAG: PLDc_N domain-containing protein [Roseitalea sp.]|jgi:drug/metabolite transporter (DMT)-like permease|uniref:PLDc_N domain-containing protein n=1 Tax=Oceaniradius stylonematis TaxID=2184161 RepID=A0A3A8AAN0_9HYPH|nr:PLD nuclease N-terminal domain-containing protein [Oceaniradius stylonematis]MBO6554265.1 PLDc_N domain-containing protein [Roseitalea sp.]MBO6953309.1 PLDc_N domain-containing protein [Rhizobiaceae bacterium]RNC91266.1 MAG: PLDc_N domain-containing protein [Oricola sp.]MBO6593656.1 PLDc_N domain-containing protein [Roseitalea sp.]MBO6601052.1 PLDc_N domain-containing protein [Roseitalea sp.]
MGIEVGGLLGLILLIAMVWAIYSTFQSSASTGAKALWTVLILVLPVIGLILWFIFGPKGGRRAAV